MYLSVDKQHDVILIFMLAIVFCDIFIVKYYATKNLYGYLEPIIISIRQCNR